MSWPTVLLRCKGCGRRALYPRMDVPERVQEMVMETCEHCAPGAFHVEYWTLKIPAVAAAAVGGAGAGF